MSNDIEKTLERIEALPPHKTVWTNRCHEGGEYQSNIQPFDTSDLWQLAASYREMAKTVERLRSCVSISFESWYGGYLTVNSVPVFWIFDLGGEGIASGKDPVEALAACEAMEGENDD